MTSRNEMVLDIKSFMTDTMALSPLEKWAYLAALMHMHLSDDGWILESNLQRIAGIDNGHWSRVRHALEPFLVRQGGKISQKRILRERATVVAKPTSAVEVGDSAHIESNPTPLRLPLESEKPDRLLSRTSVRARQLPDTWKPSLQDEQYAQERGLSVKDEFDAFQDYHVGKGTRWTDWSRAWKTWCRNAVKFSKRNGGKQHGKSFSAAADRLVQWADDEAKSGAGGQNISGFLPSRPIR